MPENIKETIIQVATGGGISSVAGSVRYLSEMRKGKHKYNGKVLILEMILAGLLGLGVYGVITNFFMVKDQMLISSIMFVVGLVYREIIDTIIEVIPEYISSFIKLIFRK